MGRVRYEKYGYIVFKARRGWVAYNTAKPFEKDILIYVHFKALKTQLDFVGNVEYQ